MRFASFARFGAWSLVGAALILALAGCGSSNNLALAKGNWAITATPTNTGLVANTSFYIGGTLTQTGASVAGTMYVLTSSTDCYDPSQQIAFTGTVNGNKLVLTSASVSSQVITVTATGTNSSLTGNYTVTGGCDDGDTGTLTATPVPSISGTWSGPLKTYGGESVTFALALTQAATASSDGTFALTGSGTFSGSSCSVSSTIDSAFVVGPYVVVQGTTDDGGTMSYIQAILNTPAAPTTMVNGSFQVQSGNCDDLENPTLTKQ